MKLQTIFFNTVLFVLTLSSASATSLRPISLEQLSTRASLIFYGKATNNEVKRDETSGRIATFTEFEVIELIKGKAGNRHTIKQIGGYHKNSKTHLLVHGVPSFQIGKNYVIFLPEKSSLGFSSPLGLHQGRFSITTVDGEQFVSNGQPLEQTRYIKQPAKINPLPLAVNADNPARARLADFMNTVRSYNSK